jgi:hypothetical protein
LEGHSDSVLSVSVTPDGRRAVSGAGGWTRKDTTLHVWDLQSGACLRTLEGHSDQVRSVSVTPDSRRAVSASYDKTLRVWDLETGACLRMLKGHSHWVRSVSVTPDGRRAVSASSDKTLRVWDLATGACLRTLEGHSSWVTSVSVTPDGRRAVSASWDETLRVWDLASGVCLRTLEGHSDEVRSVSVTSDGRWAVSASSDKTLRVWDLASGACVALFSASASVWSVAVSPSKAAIVCGTSIGEVLFLESRGIEFGLAVLTVSRFLGRPGGTGIRHVVRCPCCGAEFEPASEIVSAIESLSSHLAPGQSPCLDLPDAAFADPRLLSTCPHCAQPLKFNPFFVDMRP